MSSGSMPGSRHSSSGWRIPRSARRDPPVVPVSERDLEDAWRLRFRDPLVEAAFREEVLLACVLIPCALLLGLPAVETVLLIGSVLLLMLVEILNSAIEAVVDRIGPELHPLSGRAKDLGSAAVFIAMIILGVTWLLIAAPALWAFLAG